MLSMTTLAKSVKRPIQSHFGCKHCGKTFVLESRYLAHRCKQMSREQEFQSPMGQAAWGYYQTWLRTMKRMPPPPKSFLTSKYYRTFINFAQFVNKVDLPRPEKFIWFMVEKSFQPTMWMSDDVYVLYLEFLDYKVSPLEQAKLSVETLLNIADKNDIDVSKVFDVMHPQDLIHLIRTRKLSPWLLLNSKKFKQYYAGKITSEQRIMLETMVRPEYWGKKFAEHTKEIEIIKRYVAEMNV